MMNWILLTLYNAKASGFKTPVDQRGEGIHDQYGK
jgi:hypothetical protein